ncbi:hypothetical protein RM549_06200 [Salegentibacter sp. F188]|uniref:Uncharacterized protein n=1 Tax=Autumnicola patrickiae TaxID=3075591 RepID=A0ABU3E106_9FLAO|nr:hypothetical protein [Salegentibacter sp. F188]MDT0689369.1 hypothetical protein [Salegentibacter sp. F188]
MLDNGLKKAHLGFKKITEDTTFSIKGMIEPTFYNFGPENVRVYHTVVKPGESFLAGVHGMVMEGEFPIVFQGENKNARDLLCYYGSPIDNCE